MRCITEPSAPRAPPFFEPPASRWACIPAAQARAWPGLARGPCAGRVAVLPQLEAVHERSSTRVAGAGHGRPPPPPRSGGMAAARQERLLKDVLLPIAWSACGSTVWRASPVVLAHILWRMAIRTSAFAQGAPRCAPVDSVGGRRTQRPIQALRNRAGELVACARVRVWPVPG